MEDGQGDGEGHSKVKRTCSSMTIDLPESQRKNIHYYETDSSHDQRKLPKGPKFKPLSEWFSQLSSFMVEVNGLFRNAYQVTRSIHSVRLRFDPIILVVDLPFYGRFAVCASGLALAVRPAWAGRGSKVNSAPQARPAQRDAKRC